MSDSVTIVGTGLAGYTLAREFRKLDKTTELTLVTGDDGTFYSKPMLSNAFAQNKTPEMLASKTAKEMSSELNAEIITHADVRAIDNQAKQLVLAEREIAYDRLVLAVGAHPITLPISGDAVDAVKSVNSLDDYRELRSILKKGDRVAIMGPGLIGCEFANDLVSAGIETVVFGPDPWPISTLLPQASGMALQQALTSAGIQFHLETIATSVDKSADRLKVMLKNGEELVVDHVLSAVGLRPNLALAQSAGLETNRGIVTDMNLRTSDASIYTLGDCAEIEGVVRPYVMPIMHAARALAKTLAGNQTQVLFPLMPVAIKTTILPIVVLPPPPGLNGQWHIEAEQLNVSARFHDGEGNLAGFTLCGTATARKQALMKEIQA